MPAISIKIVRISTFVVFLAGLVTGIVRATTDHSTHRTSIALIFASALMLVGLVLLEAAQVGGSLKGFGWVSVILGADGRISTSKTSVWLWTIGLSYALLFLAGIRIFTGIRHHLFVPTNWDEYLILIGGPFAAAVLAKYTVVTKLIDGTLGKTTLPTSASPSAISTGTSTDTSSMADAATNDNGGLDLIDSQYLLFNIVAFSYAAGVFISNNFNHTITPSHGKFALPGIPAILLGLTSAAAATYVGNKAIQKTGPQISVIAPATNVAIGTTVTITGVNLVPARTPPSTAASQTIVWLNAADGTGSPVSIASTSATPKAVTFEMPPGFQGKTVSVYVVSAGGLPTGVYPIEAV